MSFSRRRSSVRPVYLQQPASYNAVYNANQLNQPYQTTWHNATTAPTSNTYAYIVQQDWLNALRAQRDFDFYAAFVVFWQMANFARVLIWGETGWPPHMTILLAVVAIHGCFCALRFWWKKFAEYFTHQ